MYFLWYLVIIYYVIGGMGFYVIKKTSINENDFESDLFIDNDDDDEVFLLNNPIDV